MTATSPYAPMRRQSSNLSNASSTRMLRRTSSGGAVSAIGGGALFWALLSFWRRVTSRTAAHDTDSSEEDRRGCFIGLHSLLDALSKTIDSNLTIVDPGRRAPYMGDELPSPPAQYRRGISAVLRWIVNIAGGSRSTLGRMVVGVVSITREILLRSIGVTSVILTGVPSGQRDGSIRQVETSNSLKDSALLNHRATPEIEQPTSLAENEDATLHLVRRDRNEIDEVLDYWFGQASPDDAQKSLWMIASSSEELLSKVDSEISDKFRALIWDLFSGSKDHNAHTTNKELGLDDLMFDSGKLHRWTDEQLFSWQGKVAAIIALDQMSRHIHRHDVKFNSEPQRACNTSVVFHIPEQKQLDNIAFKVSKLLQNKHQRELSTGMIPLPMRIFGIMPLRHASTIDNLAIVQSDIEAAASLHDEMDKMIRRFRKATNRRMAGLQDSARREGKLGSLNSEEGDSNGTHGPHEFDDEQILENFPFDADMSHAHEHVVIKTIRNFLRSNNVLQSTDPRFSSSRRAANGHDAAPLAGNKAAATPHTPTAIVSLSGGVDSMVIASALAYIRDTEAGLRGVEPDSVLLITAIHIDYANRPESSAEASYVERYCKRVGAKFVCRRIDEVTRGVTARDDYERIAREIRFDLYRRCSSDAEGNHGSKMNQGSVGDLRENVISNAHKGCGPLDLSGMTAVSKNDGVTLFRPLLPLEKTSIFDYAHTFGVPYFKDTTPHWSTRGKLRNRLLPLLEEIYGEGSMDNLSSLAEESYDARALVQQAVMGPFLDQVKYYPMGILFETALWKNCGLFFWKFVLRNVLHSAGRGMFSDKSVESFLERIRASNLKEGWLQCRKDYAVYMKKDGKVLVFHPLSFPFEKKDQYHLPPGPIEYGREIQVGPWCIIANVIPDMARTDLAENLTKKKALDTIEQLLPGNFHYYLQVPIIKQGLVPEPLVFVKGYTKPTRPAAWKGFDIKVEQTLPLLGNDHTHIDTVFGNCLEQYGQTWALVKVQLTLGKDITINGHHH
ncbi:hypothetical protein HJC23_004171 [Cyclotella cryptica]|uniref:tRNA(Ile)-lysidine synthetase n=1 Tax=Cyclotella cryptica TaxID=29204 RepID=A0ABD3NX97_9STRA|eukprot:CCRYP_018964-RA/>CCRYP_018964-RA protein AED:0.10 eAED:0.10 QI:0/0.66/0.75/1/0.66/0.5/4/1183/1009